MIDQTASFAACGRIAFGRTFLPVVTAPARAWGREMTPPALSMEGDMGFPQGGPVVRDLQGLAMPSRPRRPVPAAPGHLWRCVI
jgi:hypothetical protein